MAGHDTPEKITYFAETDYRSKRVKFGIRDDDRAKHMYIIGKTGMGKSTLLENLAVQDIQNGEGICFIDPHGGTAETLLSYVPEHRIRDVIYFAPFDQEFPVALNVMEDLGKDKRPLIVSGLIGAFKKVWVDAWSPRMEYLLSNALLALLETPGSTLLGVNRMFADKNFRNSIIANVTDPSVRAFWLDEFAKYSDKFATEATAAIQNKIGQFAANPLIRNMVGQPVSTFDIRRVMDERKILIVNLSKGRMGEGNANLVGSMLITKIYLAAMSRADVGVEVVKGLPPFYLYVDEFQSFANESFADILSEARKYKLSLTIAHQYIEQMSEEVRAAVFGNVGSMVTFRVGAYDAEVLEKEFAPAFTAEDLVNLGFAQIYLKLMIRGVGSAPFSATTLSPVKKPLRDFSKEVVAASREQFARPRAEVEADIIKWHEPIVDAQREGSGSGAPETRKYAPGSRPPPREEGARAPRASGDGKWQGRSEGRQASSESLRSVLADVLPKEKEDVSISPPPPVASTAEIAPALPSKNDELNVPSAPQENFSAPVTPRRGIVVPRAPYAPAKEEHVNKQGLPPPLPSAARLKIPLPIPKKPGVPIPPLITPVSDAPDLSARGERRVRTDERPDRRDKEEQGRATTQPPPVHKPFAEEFAKLAQDPAPVPPDTNSPVSSDRRNISESRPVRPEREERVEQRMNVNPVVRAEPEERPLRERTPEISSLPRRDDTERRPASRPTSGSITPRPSLVPDVAPKSAAITPAPAPLAMLKSNAKKDKGPSEQNLSSLREVLRAATQATARPENLAATPPVAATPVLRPSEPSRREFLPSVDEASTPQDEEEYPVQHAPSAPSFAPVRETPPPARTFAPNREPFEQKREPAMPSSPRVQYAQDTPPPVAWPTPRVEQQEARRPNPPSSPRGLPPQGSAPRTAPPPGNPSPSAVKSAPPNHRAPLRPMEIPEDVLNALLSD